MSSKNILGALMGLVVFGIFLALIAVSISKPPESPRHEISFYNEIAALHENGLNAWDDYDYWEQIITRDISHRVEIVCAHGVAFFLHDGQLIPMDTSTRVDFSEARDVCKKREQKY